MANRYWIGGDGNWSDTAHWSTASGGAGGASAPSTADVAIFDANSDLAGAAFTATVDTATTITTLTISAVDVLVTIASTTNLTVSGACGISSASASAGLKVTSNFTIGTTITLTSGVFDFTDVVVTAGISISSNNSNTRSMVFGTTGKIVLSGSATTIWNTATLTGFSYTGTPLVECTYAGGTGTRVISGGSAGALETNVISFKITGGTDTLTFTTSHYVLDLDFNTFGGTLSDTVIRVFGNLTISSGMTVAASSNVIGLYASSGTKTIKTNNNNIDKPITFGQTVPTTATFQLQDNLTVGSTRTVTLTNGTLDLNNNTLSCGLFSSNTTNTRSIAFGTGNITVTGSGATVWNMANVNNFSYTGTPTVYSTYSGATGTRTLAHGTAGGSGPKAVSLNITTGSDTVTVSNNSQIKDLNFTGFSGTVTNTSLFTFGNVTFSATSTLQSGTNELRFYSTSGTQQVTTNGLTLDFPITAFASGATVVFQDALTQGSTRAFTMRDGTTVKLKAGATSTVGAFTTSGSNQKYLQSTTAGSQATLSQASGTVTVSYLSVKDIAATGGATWNAYVDFNNVDQGGNTGWDFSYSPAIDNEFPVALRSFTQPKRF